MSFSIDIGLFAKKSKQTVSQAKREMLLRLFRSIVMDTPVDEGTLRSNWQINAVDPLTDPLALRALTEVLSEMDRVLSSASLEDTIFLNNNLPYAYGIEFFGWSHTKAPQGMVRKNILRLTRIAQEVARNSR